MLATSLNTAVDGFLSILLGLNICSAFLSAFDCLSNICVKTLQFLVYFLP